ncbi:hemagglutinin repeat-containing protein, partial [Mycobacterium tuberculosis]
LYAGENLQLTAINNINNVSSSISGQKVALESVNGDINNTTATTLWQMNASSNERNIVTAKQTFVGPTATITSLGSLSLKSGNDINIKGANLSAGGDLLINAWHDIAITNNQVTSGLAFQNSGNQKVTN